MAFSENTKTEIQIREIKAKTILLFFIVITITVGVVSLRLLTWLHKEIGSRLIM